VVFRTAAARLLRAAVGNHPLRFLPRATGLMSPPYCRSSISVTTMYSGTYFSAWEPEDPCRTVVLASA
jgi:hypothetical protein